MIGFELGSYHISLYLVVEIAAALIVVMALGRLSGLFFRRLFSRMQRLDPAQQLLGEKLSTITAWIVLSMAAIDFVGIDLTTLKVFSGALGLAIGFGLQKTFGNLISGLILLMDRSIKPGDVIAVGSGAEKTVGQVNRIGIRAVSVITRDKIEYLIPNELLMTSQVENWSFTSRDVRVKVVVPVAYGTDIARAEAAILAEARKLPRTQGHPEPQVWLTAFADSAILFEVQLWIDDPEDGMSNLKSDLLKGIWTRFAAEGIEVPFPRRDIRIRPWPDHGDAPGSGRSTDAES